MLYNLLPRLKELFKKSVSYGNKSKLEGANEEDKGGDDKDVVGEQLVEVGIAKDQVLSVGRNPKYSRKDYCPNSHSRDTKHQKDFPDKKRNVLEINILGWFTCPACLLQTSEDRIQ